MNPPPSPCLHKRRGFVLDPVDKYRLGIMFEKAQERIKFAWWKDNNIGREEKEQYFLKREAKQEAQLNKKLRLE